MISKQSLILLEKIFSSEPCQKGSWATAMGKAEN
jgi:hypothetical protein